MYAIVLTQWDFDILATPNKKYQIKYAKMSSNIEMQKQNSGTWRSYAPSESIWFLNTIFHTESQCESACVGG